MSQGRKEHPTYHTTKEG